MGPLQCFFRSFKCAHQSRKCCQLHIRRAVNLVRCPESLAHHQVPPACRQVRLVRLPWQYVYYVVQQILYICRPVRLMHCLARLARLPAHLGSRPVCFRRRQPRLVRRPVHPSSSMTLSMHLVRRPVHLSNMLSACAQKVHVIIQNSTQTSRQTTAI